MAAVAPFEAGQRAKCSRDGRDRVCEVLQWRPAPAGSAGPAGVEYYVHFVGLDRRLDTWVDAHELAELSEGEKKVLQSAPNGDGLEIEGQASPLSSGRRLTRQERRRFSTAVTASPEAEMEKLDPMTLALEKEHEEKTKVKNIDTIQIGPYELDVWYFSPYPEEFCARRKLYICQFCFKYMRKLRTLDKHMSECQTKHPPGNEIYRDGNVAVFEVDGARNKVYCQCLCLMSKLFLDHKTLYYDVEPFLFYILCEYIDGAYVAVGYFSKEKESPQDYNVACILTFPQHQRKGYGRFLIQLSYELTKLENKVGTPEKPLSDLGQRGYHSYWREAVMDALRPYDKYAIPSVEEISRITGIMPGDIVLTMQSLGLMQYSRGRHHISPNPPVLQQHLEELDKKRSARAPSSFLELKLSRLVWKPFEVPREQGSKRRHVSSR